MRGFNVVVIAVTAGLFILFGTSAATAAPALSAVPASAQVATSAPAVAVPTSVPASASYIGPFDCSQQHVVLSYGSRGTCVAVFQRWSNAWGVSNWHAPHLVVDGVFGSNTWRAVIMAQRVFGIYQDGVIGPRTWYGILSLQ
jgi:peptidoglycan hydrolase-like protein with peptidoglycan-binding domain